MQSSHRSLIAAAISLSLVCLVSPAWSATGPTDQRHRDHRDTPKLVFSPEFVARGVTTPEAIAQAFVADQGDRFSLPKSMDDLQIVEVRQSLLGTHVRYQQFINGLPVEGAEFIVSVGQDGQILKVFNNTYPVVREPAVERAVLDTDQAIDIAWNHLRVHGELLDMAPEAELAYVPEGTGFRLAYLTRVDVAAPHGAWQHRIDASTGEILEVIRLDIPRKPLASTKNDFGKYAGPVADRFQLTAEFEAREAARQASRSASRAVVDGTGQTFDPDPKTTLANAALLDTSPAATFNPAYFTKTLSDITETSGTYRLEGPWVEIINFESPATAPSTTTDGVWTAVRGNNAFNDTMTYFHIDQNQRYIQSLGFTGPTAIQDGPIETDTDGFNGDDNSHYFPGTNRLGFGHGGVDDNEDIDVILHEYMHGITHDINSSWGGADTGAIGEGLGDYWGGSYSYSTPNGPTFHPEWAFSWDGHGTDTWSGRVMNLNPATNQYSSSCTYGAHSTCGGVSGDELWSTPIFQALVELVALGETREEVDTIMLESQFGLGANIKMPDMANAIVAAAQALYPAGPHANVFQTKFADHNILDLPAVTAATITSPSSGTVVPAGGTVDITWNTNGAPATTVYSVEFTDQCTPFVVFQDDMESGDGNWTVSHDSGSADWALVTTSPHSGTTSWFATDPSSITDQFVETAAAMTVPSGGSLSFWHSYNVESGYDGGVVEISTNGGTTWTDLGSDMTQNAYNATISTSYNSPIGGRSAFTGDSAGYLQTVVDLSAYAASDVLIRFRMATDSSSSDVGWWVDDVTVSATGTWTAIGTSAAGASTMSWTAPAVAGVDYCLRITASAPGHTAAESTSEIFEVGNSNLIFADGFDSGSVGAWSGHTP